jgi:hypothetical protein
VRTGDSYRGKVRTGEPRREQLKGIAEPVEIVSIDWRGVS